MERVEGALGGRFCFRHGNFAYIRSHSTAGITDVTCRVNTCGATASFPEGAALGEQVSCRRDHNHVDDIQYIDLIRFENELRRRARETTDHYRRIYDDASPRLVN